jgi:hypothetical protein
MRCFVQSCVSAAILVCGGVAFAAEQVLETPSQLWAGYDPNEGDFKEEIVREETKDGIYSPVSH